MNRNVFDRRFRAFQIPKEELDRMYLMELESSITAPSEEAFQMSMMNEFLMSSGAGGVIVGGDPEPIPSNTIQFTIDTTNNTNLDWRFRSTEPTTFSIDWGDGDVEEYEISQEYDEDLYDLELSKNYDNESTFNGIITFTDASLITYINFDN
jgi:hypothetical protein